MEEKTMTLEEVITDAIQKLSNINIPVAFTENIGVPVVQVVRNLQQCMVFLEAKRKEAEDGRETDPE